MALLEARATGPRRAEARALEGAPERSGGMSGEPSRAGPEAPATSRYDALFREHEAAVRRLCQRMLGPEAARDASQEVFLRARRGFDSWDPARPFRSWLLAVAGNHCIDQLRRRGLEARIFDPRDFQGDDLLHPGPSPLRQALHSEQRASLLDAIDALPEKYRLPLVLRYFQELDYDGIAELLGVTRAQVGTLLFRAKRRLRTALAAGRPDAAGTGERRS
ncbi:MAG: sigma-70 family RNA polymerase sigma factor [Myxococcota bacterium]|nr:sigma-70 family RNA polymerase sigma factor [Myxococcota bacterium]